MAQPRSCGCIPSSGGRASSLASEHLDRRQLDAAARRGPGVHGRAGGQEERVVGSQGRGAGPVVDYRANSRFPEDPGHGVCSLFDVDARPAVPSAGVYLRSVHTRDTAAQQMQRLAGNPRQLKLVESLMETAALITPPAMFTRSTCGHFLAARAAAIASLDSGRRGSGGGAARAASAAPQAAHPASLHAPAALPTAAAAAAAASAAAAIPGSGAATGGGGAPLPQQARVSPEVPTQRQGATAAAGTEAPAAPPPSPPLTSRGATPETDTPRDGGRVKRAKTKAPQKLEDVAAGAGITPRSDKRARSARKYVDD